MDVPRVSVANSSFPQCGVKNFAFKGLDVLEAVIAPNYRDRFSLIINRTLALRVSVGMRSWMIDDDISDAGVVPSPTYQNRCRRRSE